MSHTGTSRQRTRRVPRRPFTPRERMREPATSTSCHSQERSSETRAAARTVPSVRRLPNRRHPDRKARHRTLRTSPVQRRRRVDSQSAGGASEGIRRPSQDGDVWTRACDYLPEHASKRTSNCEALCRLQVRTPVSMDRPFHPGSWLVGGHLGLAPARTAISAGSRPARLARPGEPNCRNASP
jgi:hypothetical protein